MVFLGSCLMRRCRHNMLVNHLLPLLMQSAMQSCIPHVMHDLLSLGSLCLLVTHPTMICEIAFPPPKKIPLLLFKICSLKFSVWYMGLSCLLWIDLSWYCQSNWRNGDLQMNASRTSPQPGYWKPLGNIGNSPLTHECAHVPFLDLKVGRDPQNGVEWGNPHSHAS